jgi:hypothetical protein
MTRSLVPRTGRKPSLVVGPWSLAKDRRGATDLRSIQPDVPPGGARCCGRGNGSHRIQIPFVQEAAYCLRPCLPLFGPDLHQVKEERVTSAAFHLTFSLTAPGGLGVENVAMG